MSKTQSIVRAYFHHFVVPAYRVFVVGYGTRQLRFREDTVRASASAGTLLDLSDRVVREFRSKGAPYTSKKQYLPYLWALSPDYRIVCDFANVCKHSNLTRHDPTFLYETDIHEDVAVVLYRDAVGRYHATQKLLTVNLLDGRVVDMGLVLSRTFWFWCDQLRALGVIAHAPDAPVVRNVFVPRQVAEAEQPVTLTFKQHEEIFVPPRVAWPLRFHADDGSLRDAGMFDEDLLENPPPRQIVSV